MNIAEILKINQPDYYKKLKEKTMKRKKRNRKKERLTESEIIILMYHPSYKRSSRGAIKQVR